MLRVFCVRIPDLNDELLLQKALPYISNARLSKLVKFQRTEDKIRSAVSELLLRYAYRMVKGNEMPLPDISYGKYGKPFFENREPRFNLSHSGNYIACVLADCEVGIDVETFSNRVDLCIADSFFSYSERIFVAEDQKLSFRRFFYIWTLKESYVKEIGMGLCKRLDSFSVEHQDDQYLIIDNGKQQPLFLRLWDNLEEISMSVCIAANGDELQNLDIEWVPLERLMMVQKS